MSLLKHPALVRYQQVDQLLLPVWPAYKLSCTCLLVAACMLCMSGTQVPLRLWEQPAIVVARSPVFVDTGLVHIRYTAVSAIVVAASDCGR